MNKDIIHFIQNQSCATVCCTDAQGKPYCFNCFYIFNETEQALYFKSSPGSKHYTLLEQNPPVAGSILPDKLKKLFIQGVQFEGMILDDAHPLAQGAATYYHTKNPMALAVPGKVWVILIDHIKMTDNKKGFGKKIEWRRQKENVAGS